MTTQVGILAVRRAIWIEAAPERVWQEFESFDRMRAWFGTGHDLTAYQPGPGGLVETDAGAWEGEPLKFGGRIIVWDPPRELTFENDWYGHGWKAPSLVTFRLTPILGGTVVELFHHGFERTGASPADTQNGFENGWDAHHLNALREIVTA